MTVDDYVRLVERNGATTSTNQNRSTARSNITNNTNRPTVIPATTSTDTGATSQLQPPPNPPPPPAPLSQTVETTPTKAQIVTVNQDQLQAPPIPPRSAQLQRLRCRIPRITDLTNTPESTPTTSSQTESSEVNNIKLRLRPSIKRTRDIVRPIIVNPVRKTLTHMDDKDHDSSLDSSTSTVAPVDTTATLDRRLRGASKAANVSRAQLNHSNENETSHVDDGQDASITSTTPALPKRRMSLRRSTRV